MNGHLINNINIIKGKRKLNEHKKERTKKSEKHRKIIESEKEEREKQSEWHQVGKIISL